MKKVLYFICQCTWGCLQTLVGLFCFLVNIKGKHYFYHGAVVTMWSSGYSASIGLFVFMSANPARDKRNPEEDTYAKTLVHEYGHTIQSLVLGPLYLPVIALPSAIWCMTPKFQQLRTEREISYYSFYTEKWANCWGEKVTGELSMRQAII